MHSVNESAIRYLKGVALFFIYPSKFLMMILILSLLAYADQKSQRKTRKQILWRSTNYRNG